MSEPRARILISDDEPETLASLKLLIESCGYAVDTAVGGRQAVDRLQRKNFDLMLLDLHMPDLDGHAVIEHARSESPDTRIIVVSGETSAQIEERVEKSGADDFIRKPYVPHELLKRMEISLGQHRLEKQNEQMRARLDRGERLHRFMIDNSPDFIFVLDSEGRFIFGNSRARTLLDIAPSELIGQHYAQLVHPDDLEHLRYACEALLDGRVRGHSLELRLHHADPAEPARHFDSHLVPVDLGAMGITLDQNPAGDGIYCISRDVSDRKRAEKIINFQASHDLLTKLPNRALFEDRLNQAVRQSRRDNAQFAVMFLDLDRFKNVNDTLGHVVGDELLQAVSSRLRSELRDGDTIARVGGDEYLLLLPDVASSENAQVVGKKVLSALERPFAVSDHELFVSASIGVSLYPDDGVQADILIRKADVAMYSVKAQSRNGILRYEASMDASLNQHVHLETELRHAIEGGQLRLHYQPQVNGADGNIVGMEALVRWEHPTRGLLAPGEFMAVAEESGLVTPLGDWVMNEALREYRGWYDKGMRSIRMAVNCSAQQIEQPDFVEKVLEALRRYDLPGDVLEVEITENALMKDMQSSIAKFRDLSTHGIKIAIDDFGTGYSSLSYLHNLPINTLKIDRAFVQHIDSSDNDGSIVTAIVNMANGLTLQPVAEGVENHSQLSFLNKLGCASMQGFFFSRPVPGKEAGILIAGRRIMAA